MEVNKEANVRPVNCMTPADIPAHLRHAADKELKDALEAGFLEPCHHSTKWCSRSFFVEKQGGGPIKVRLVSDFRGINRILRRPGYPYEGSSQILRRLNPKEPFFSTIDLSSGYHQCEIDERDRDLFAVVLHQVKFRFKELPLGIAPASDIFNILMDTEIRNQDGYFKNMDDILTTGNSVTQLE